MEKVLIFHSSLHILYKFCLLYLILIICYARTQLKHYFASQYNITNTISNILNAIF